MIIIKKDSTLFKVIPVQINEKSNSIISDQSKNMDKLKPKGSNSTLNRYLDCNQKSIDSILVQAQIDSANNIPYFGGNKIFGTVRSNSKTQGLETPKLPTPWTNFNKAVMLLEPSNSTMNDYNIENKHEKSVSWTDTNDSVIIKKAVKSLSTTPEKYNNDLFKNSDFKQSPIKIMEENTCEENSKEISSTSLSYTKFMRELKMHK